MLGRGLNFRGSDAPVITKDVDWRRILALFAPYWRQQAAVLLCIVAGSVLGLAPAFLTARIIDSALPHRDVIALSIDVGFIVAAALAASSINVMQGFFNSIIGEGIMRDIRTSLVAHLQRMPISFFTGTKTGEIMNRVSGDVDNVDSVVSGTLATIITNVVSIVTTLSAMFIWNWRLALISVAVLPLMILPLAPVGRRMYDIRKKARQKRDEIESITQETLSISGITLIKSFARESFERSRFFEVCTRLMHLQIDLAMVGRWFMASLGAMIIVGPAIVWLTGGWYAIHSGLAVGVIFAFVTFVSTRLYGSTAALAGVQVQIVGALAVFERIFGYLDLEPEIYVPLGATDLENAVGGIRFEDVTFSYDGVRDVLRGLSLTIEPGQVAAFVGPSGSGKTTIMQLVSRLYEPTGGSVFIDGYPISKVTLESLRRDIGVVTQETYLFHDTIACNLRYGALDATNTEMEAAARAANIHDFITTLPDGYDTIVGERGHKLSGGERQRLAIARMLLKNPRILILDEATSSLDSENEAAIQRAFETVIRGRTSLVVAHRLSTVQSADIIFVIDHGQVVERGQHTELLLRGGVYSRLHRTQFPEVAAV